MEYGSELFVNVFEEFLDSSRVIDEGWWYFEVMGRDGVESGLDVVGNLFNEVRWVFVLYVVYLIFNFFYRDFVMVRNRVSIFWNLLVN